MCPTAADIDIEDIAHALSMLCRFGGHSRCFYSVAQHCVLCATIGLEGFNAPLPVLQQLLLHDAAEAYVGDVVRPLNVQLADFARVENRVWRAITQRFGVSTALDPLVKHINNIALLTERNALIDPKWNSDWHHLKDCAPWPDFKPWSQPVAKARFLARFHALFPPTLYAKADAKAVL